MPTYINTTSSRILAHLERQISLLFNNEIIEWVTLNGVNYVQWFPPGKYIVFITEQVHYLVFLDGGGWGGGIIYQKNVVLGCE